MKKLVLAMAVFLGVTSMASSALAYFEGGRNGTLALSIYNKDNNECAIDLGNILELLADERQNVEVAPAGSWSIDMFPGLTLADLNVTAVASDSQTTAGYFNLFFGRKTSDTPLAGSTRAYLMFHNASQYSLGAYSDSGEQVAVLPSVDDNSYYTRMVGNAEVEGFYMGIVTLDGDEDTEANMVDIETQGFVDVYLFNYFRQLPNAGVFSVDPVAVIRVMADGSVVMNPTVPIPGSLALLSSGLLGLVGIRRKNA